MGLLWAYMSYYNVLVALVMGYRVAKIAIWEFYWFVIGCYLVTIGWCAVRCGGDIGGLSCCLCC